MRWILFGDTIRAPFPSNLVGQKKLSLPLINSTRIELAILPRIVLAVVLVIALLSGIAPFKSAAARNLCTMACCAGLAPHASGSCHMEMAGPGKLSDAIAPEPEPETLCGLPEAERGGAGPIATRVKPVLKLDAVTVDASDHCQVNSQTEDIGAPSGDSSGPSDESDQTATSVAANSFAKPCPPGCGSGSPVSRTRRSSDAAALAQDLRPRSTYLKKYFYQRLDVLNLSARLEQLHPRGPPVSFF